jgi:uncharacterized protein (DUF362 family)/Pyruvate/2-oxoacid:ferredoxin oxidoreductase delta subunit
LRMFNEERKAFTVKVSLLQCEEYSVSILKEKMLQGLSATGVEPSIFSGKKVIIKPNLLNASAVEKAVVTHPEFFRSVVQIVKSGGGKPVMAESPAFQSLSKVMNKTGYDRIVAEEGCEVADPKATGVLFWDGHGRYKRFEVSKALFDADIVINLPKFKTHSLTYVTGAVKNLFGFIYGLNKSQWHVRARTKEEFSSLLLDLYESLMKGFEKPKRFIHIMDAIVGLEGEGPGASGHPRRIGALLVSEDAVALDCVAVHLVGLQRDKARSVVLGEERRLGAGSLERIDIRGSALDDFQVSGYVPSKSNGGHPAYRWPLNTNFFKNLILEKPVPTRERCTLCYQCKAICPGGAISESQGDTGIPMYNHQKCIRCYCCMEICPESAISLKRGKLQWVLDLTRK